MMTPYFERNGITIFKGDCREILPTLGRWITSLLTLRTRRKRMARRGALR